MFFKDKLQFVQDGMVLRERFAAVMPLKGQS